MQPTCARATATEADDPQVGALRIEVQAGLFGEFVVARPQASDRFEHRLGVFHLDGDERVLALTVLALEDDVEGGPVVGEARVAPAGNPTHTQGDIRQSRSKRP